MKKIFLIITLLTTFFLSPIKADSYEDDPYFVAISFLDLTQLGMGTEVPMQITWYFHTLPPVKMIYRYESTLTNMTNIIASGTATIDSGNGTVLTATFEWRPFNEYATLNYMGLEFTADNFFASINGTVQDAFTVGNGYEWWTGSQEETPSSDIDLSTIQTYLLIISFLLFINFLRG